MREDEPRGSETTLSLSLSKSINEEALSSLSGIAEVGLDSIFEEGFLKDIPILATLLMILPSSRTDINNTLVQEIETKRSNT